MKKIRETLWLDYQKVSKQLDEMKVDTEGYKAVLDERDKLRNELLELTKMEEERNIKLAQLESESKRESIRNGITISTFIISTGVSLYAINKTFKFDQVATVTSTLGRSILNGVVPKMLKR